MGARPAAAARYHRCEDPACARRRAHPPHPRAAPHLALRGARRHPLDARAQRGFRASPHGHCLTRKELGTHFARARLPGESFRLAHIALYVELEGVICSGPRREKQATYALLDERAPNSVRLPREEALGELARRYFQSHGPATLRDYVWWSGLNTADARRGLDMNRGQKLELDGSIYWTIGRSSSVRPRRQLVHLLPIYDEYLVAYRDRAAVPHGPSMIASRAGGYVQFQHPLVIMGQVAGTWRAVQTANGVQVKVAPMRRLTSVEQRALQREVARYQRFLEIPVSFSLTI
jgi:hypothetical protein